MPYNTSLGIDHSDIGTCAGYRDIPEDGTENQRCKHQKALNQIGPADGHITAQKSIRDDHECGDE